jgi:aarF domain-containing kinase
MSGKRVLDAIALLNASKNVAVKHFDIRLGQAAIYTQTSSIFKAIRREAPPAVSYAAASFSQTVAQAAKQPAAEGIKQDHFYERSAENDPADQLPQQDLNIEQKQADRQPLPDGTIPPRDSPIGAETGDAETFNQRPTAGDAQHPIEGGQDLNVKSASSSTIPEPSVQKPLGSTEARKAQRMSEDPIPAATADPPREEDMADFSIEQEQDVFYQPPGTTSPVLSALPRMRVPKSENDVQAGDSHIPEGINADVYYSGRQKKGGAAEEEELTEEQLSQIFSSPKIGSMLGKGKAKYAPGGVGSRKFHTSSRAHQKSAEAERKDIEKLAAEMAKDVQQTEVRNDGFRL